MSHYDDDAIINQYYFNPNKNQNKTTNVNNEMLRLLQCHLIVARMPLGCRCDANTRVYQALANASIPLEVGSWWEPRDLTF